ncbi:MAG: lysophospholipid acyltransferase family protein [Candidatus Cloacimonadaceae bacterium]
MKIPSWLMHCERKAGALFLRCLAKTIRFNIINKPPDDFKCIFMFWHRDILLMTLHRIGSDACVAISSSQDGELIAGPVEELGFVTARGSTNRQGSNAYRMMLRMAKERQLGITPDGPKGPSKVIQPGVARIAYTAQVPIIAVAMHADREWIFHSWDKFRLPKPFCTVTAIYGEPFYIKTREELDNAIPALTNLFAELEEKLPS